MAEKGSAGPESVAGVRRREAKILPLFRPKFTLFSRKISLYPSKILPVMELKPPC